MIGSLPSPLYDTLRTCCKTLAKSGPMILHCIELNGFPWHKTIYVLLLISRFSGHTFMHYAKSRRLCGQKCWYTNIIYSRLNVVLTFRKLGIRQWKAVRIDLVSTPQLWCNCDVVIWVIFEGSAFIYQATLKVEPLLMHILRRAATRPELYILHSTYMPTIGLGCTRIDKLQQQSRAELFSISGHAIRKRGEVCIIWIFKRAQSTYASKYTEY